MQRAAVTGAAGFIGGALSRRLQREGVEVVGVDLRANPAAGIVGGDLTENGEWSRAFKGCDAVFHTAAAVTNTADHERGWRLNVLATRNAIVAAAEAGVRRFIHLSSIRAFSDRDFPTVAGGVSEDHPVRPDGSVYVDTKIASEQVALQAHAEGLLEVTVIRPGDVYGPGSRPWTILIVEAIAAGQFALPAMGRGIFSPAYVDNLLDGIVLAADRSEGAGQVFTISDGGGISTKAFFGHYFRMLGKRGPLCLPTPVAMTAVTLPELIGDLRGRPTEVRRESMRYLARTGTYSIAKARRVLGYEPQVDLAEGMRRTERWLREQGMLPARA